MGCASSYGIAGELWKDALSVFPTFLSLGYQAMG